MIFRRFSGHCSHEKNNCPVKNFDIKFLIKHTNSIFQKDIVGLEIWYHDYFGGV